MRERKKEKLPESIVGQILTAILSGLIGAIIVVAALVLFTTFVGCESPCDPAVDRPACEDGDVYACYGDEWTKMIDCSDTEEEWEIELGLDVEMTCCVTDGPMCLPVDFCEVK